MWKATISTGEAIREMVARIVDRFEPERIILFGSHARGVASPDSDVDLLIVMPVATTKRQLRLDVRRALREVHVPKDIIVTSPEEYAWRKDVPGTIEASATREGRELYVRG